MHNRARLITGHFLTKTLYIDWREGAQHFVDLLLDADVANNTMNWQWVAGTGTDSRFNRTYNVTLQARRHDPTGAYVRRYVEELADVDDAYVHEPWLLPEERVRGAGLPAADRRPAGGQGAPPPGPPRHLSPALRGPAGGAQGRA